MMENQGGCAAKKRTSSALENRNRTPDARGVVSRRKTPSGSPAAYFDGHSHRAIYTVKLARVVYILHVFQKKSTRGIATPKHELAVIRERWRRAREHYATHYAAKGQ